MDKNEFIKEIKDRLQMILGEDFKIEETEVLKNNGVRKSGLSVSKIGEKVVPVLYVQDMYDRYLENGDMDMCVKELLKLFEETRHTTLKQNFWKWDVVKDYVYPVLLSKELNQELLENLIYEPNLDLVICYQICMQDEQLGDLTFRVQQELMQIWGISEKELRLQAQKNFDIQEYRLIGIEDVLNLHIEADSETGSNLGSDFKVLTNKTKKFAAVGILKKDILENYAAQLDMNLFLLPASIHEFLVLPDDGNITEDILNYMIWDVNETQIHKDEKLSHHVYYYDREKKEIRIGK